MSVIRIAFLGTPDFAKSHLQSLLNDEHYDVVGVVSQPDRPSGRKMKLQPSPVKQLALEHDIPVLSPEKITPDVIEEIAGWKAEAAVVVAFGQILSQQFLDLFPGKVVNVHGSLLPLWRGAAPIQRSIMAGDKETGVSLQVMVKKLDAGAVLGERKIEISDEMDAITLHEDMKVMGSELLHVEFMDYLRGNLTPVEQDEAQVTYAHKLCKSESKIDWSQPARIIFNHMRGMKLGPGTYSFLHGKKMKFHHACVSEVQHTAQPGEILEVKEQSFVIACGQGALEMIEVQPESRAKMKVVDFLKGYSIQVGERFGDES